MPGPTQQSVAKSDAYVSIMVMEYSGVGLTKHAPVNAYSSNGMYGIGLRYRF